MTTISIYGSTFISAKKHFENYLHVVGRDKVFIQNINEYCLYSKFDKQRSLISNNLANRIT